MLAYLGSVAIGAMIAVMLVAVIGSLFNQHRSRLIAAGIAGAWVGLAVALTAFGALRAIATLPVVFAMPLLVATGYAIASPDARSAFMRIPLPLIISLNAMRVVGALFLLLTAASQLAGPFPYFAGIGDIITGAFALSIARTAARQSVNPRVVAWNLFGALDLVVAVILAVTSLPDSPIELIHAGIGSAAITTLPWSLIPLVLVPAYLIGHVLVLAHVRWRPIGRSREYASSST